MKTWISNGCTATHPQCVRDTDVSLPAVLANINVLLRGLFKGAPSGAFLKLAYITGILLESAMKRKTEDINVR